MILDPCAVYLECRYDRVQALRAITRRLTHQLYSQGSISHSERRRLTRRLARAHRHIIALTGDRGA